MVNEMYKNMEYQLKNTGMLEDCDMRMPPKNGRMLGIGSAGIVRG